MTARGMLHISRPEASGRTSFRPPTRPFAPPSAVRHAAPKEPRADSVLIQRATYNTLRDVWTNEFPLFADMEAYRNDDILSDYLEAQEVLPYVDFMNVPGSDPLVDPNVHREDGRKTVKFDRTNPKNWDPHFFIATIIHELIHVSNALKYQKNLVGNHSDSQYLNLHLPEAVGEVVDEGLTQNQLNSVGKQVATLNANWTDLIDICEEEYREIDQDDDEKPFMKHVRERIIYGGGASLKETDTVLFDTHFYMVQKDLEHTATFSFVRRMLREARDRRNTPGTLARRVEKDAYLFQFWKW
jgi:hypothetical protein